MAKPKGMYLRGSTWWARKDIPKPLQEIIGQTSLKRTLETGDLRVARVRFHPVMAGFEAQIADARRTVRQEPRETKGTDKFTFTLDEMGMSPEHKALYLRYEATKPENQIRSMLTEAKLIGTAKEPIRAADHRSPIHDLPPPALALNSNLYSERDST